MIEENPSFGYRTVAHLLDMNKNTVQRVFQIMGWQVRKQPVGFRPRIQALPSVASINLRAEPDRLHLSYRVRIAGGEWESIEEPVRIVRVPCPFGGARPYFICPGVVNSIACGRRVAKLHGPGRYFLCRHCYRLAHASQSEGLWDRTLRRANKIKQRLGGDPGMAAPFPKKPKGMWWRTYERLRDECFDAEMRADEAFTIHTERLLAHIDNRKPTRR